MNTSSPGSPDFGSRSHQERWDGAAECFRRFVIHLGLYVGLPRATDAMLVARDILETTPTKDPS